MAAAALSPAPPATVMPAVRPKRDGDLRTQLPARLAALDQRRHVIFRQVRRREQLRRPGARAGVEPARAGGIRHFGNMLARQPQSQVIFRQQHLPDLGEHFRLVVLHPGEFRRGEAGKDNVAGNLAETRIGIELGSFGMGAHVVPHDAGPQHRVIRAEQRRAMHVAGKPDAPHRRHFGSVIAPECGQRGLGGGDPVCRILLRPALARPRQFNFRRGGIDNGLIRIDEQRLDARRAEVDPEIHDAPPRARSPRPCVQVKPRCGFSSRGKINRFSGHLTEDA
jgi:hypothetical protein